MASLKDTVVQGSLRATDTLFSTIAQFQILHAPTTNGGSTYGIGSNGQIIKSNGTNIYWGTDEDTKVTQIPTTTNATYELLFSYTSNNNELTENARKTNTLTYNPSTKALLIGSNYDGTINGLTLTPSATSGFSISGGTSSKTLTVNNNYTLNNACEKDYTDNSNATNVTYDDEKLITARTLYYQLDNFGIYSQNANLVFAGPTSGGVATVPSFRSLVAADIPTISILNQTSGTLSIERGGTGVTTIADIQAGKDGDGNTISSTYLKLNGGTMTGKITFNNVINAIAYTGTNATYDMISFIDNTDDEYGNGIYIGGGGATIIGGGESAATAAAQVTGGSEILYLCNDGDVNVFSNIQDGWDNRKTFTFNTGGNLIMPSGARIGESGGALYLGNSSNASWLYVQDMASQSGSDKWKILSGGNATFAGTVTAGAFSGPLTGNVTGNCSGSAGSVAWGNVSSKPSYYDAKAIKSITRSGTTFTYTCLDGTTGTFTQQDNNTTYSFSDKNVTLSWGTKSTIATVGGTDIHVTMPANPNTNTTYSAGTGLSLSGTTFKISTVPVANGGTGSTSASGARTNLGVYSGTVSITSNSSGDATITSSTISINFKPSVFVATPCTSASTGYYISYNKDSSTTSAIKLKVYSGTTKVAVSSLRINYVAIN